MSSQRSMITIATDPETKERIRHHARAAGVDLSTYVSVAIHEAMRRDEEVARSFAVLDAMIEEAEADSGSEDSVKGDSSPPAPGAPAEESASIARALDDFFAGQHRGRDAA
ncbi:hypothetical protein ACTWP5_04350 [Streptomyces sp. 4N509B]|uniref:hypothetical protein n=1 Tax=Streptomyces sp. 4N509B TaxID=3457413 RepID=UPI003FD61E06